MFQSFDKCIFCFSQLPEKKGGAGEHVIPLNIYGFWRSYDICDDCRQHFGNNIDQLSIQNPWILKAMKVLELPEQEKYSENLPYIGKDTIGGYTVEMVRRTKSFKPKVLQYKDQFFECSEVDWTKIGIPWIKSTMRTNLDEDIIEKELSDLEKRYEAIKPGETVRSEILQVNVRKRQVTGVELDLDKLSPISPLIAKIAVFFLVYALPMKVVSNLIEVNSLVDHARYGKSTREHFINWCPLFPKEHYTKIHAIKMHSFDNTIILDISLFGYPNWRMILDSTEKISFQSVEKINYDTMIYFMDFRNVNDKQKLIAVQPLESNDFIYFDVNG